MNKSLTAHGNAKETPIGPNLRNAELFIQRAEFQKAKDLLQKQLDQGADDFRTWNLLGICLARTEAFDQAAAIFKRFSEARIGKAERHKALFNQGLVVFFRDLKEYGDHRVANTFRALPAGEPTLAVPETGFREAVDLWFALLKRRTAAGDILHTHLAFAFLQRGEFDHALMCIRNALSTSEQFYLTQYVLGCMFLDLYFLATEQNHWLIDKDTAEFFEIENYEVLFTNGPLHAVQKETYLEIAMQAFLEGHRQNPFSVVTTLALCRTYLIAGLLEEGFEVLAHAESLAPEYVSVLETALVFHQQAGAPPQTIISLLNRIREQRLLTPQRPVTRILPPHYQF
ncbi:hypothetical protein [Acanthopleuribacter pedis]|uniref:Tetratricopeptide repeat protein n=1 Tax=Acanthopleuribacter pedis TaxID=442870 RepID=A0A8J7U6C8_9BACT|nr:hypothetical protein [Acanthopleuribacter pedis]MBO1321328.1 hypothetical protein [Acanthopleuribacter pedis]